MKIAQFLRRCLCFHDWDWKEEVAGGRRFINYSLTCIKCGKELSK